jgi:segregation and condensation protein B
VSAKKTPDPPADDLLAAAVGAAIFASDEPVRPEELAEAFGSVEIGEVERAIRGLQESYDGNGCGLRLEKIAGGYRLATRPEVGHWVREFIRTRNRARLSPAGLETLAIVAYRQPVTAPEIQAIRGRDSTGALGTLLEKKLVRILGKKKVVGRPLLYGTSKQFLVHFGLDSLGDLPSIEAFDQFLEALEAGQPGIFDAVAKEKEEDAREDGGVHE